MKNCFNFEEHYPFSSSWRVRLEKNDSYMGDIKESYKGKKLKFFPEPNLRAFSAGEMRELADFIDSVAP